MSWMARRQTTRIEDLAYSLMGIFDVNIPLLYGEGEKAFVRLQEEIVKDDVDHTLFAWNAKEDRQSLLQSGPCLSSIFAKHPGQFAHSNEMDKPRFHGREIQGIQGESYTPTNLGVRMKLCIVPYEKPELRRRS